MIKPEQVPDTAAQAAYDVLVNRIYNGKPIDLKKEFDQWFHYAIVAALNAWPGITMTEAYSQELNRDCVILPIKHEDKTNDT